MTIGKKIKKLRLAHGLTHKQLADKIGVSKSAISYWETGKNEPTLYALIGMADVFGITLDELCCRDIRKRRGC